jgi:hypothetical protein
MEKLKSALLEQSNNIYTDLLNSPLLKQSTEVVAWYGRYELLQTIGIEVVLTIIIFIIGLVLYMNKKKWISAHTVITRIDSNTSTIYFNFNNNEVGKHVNLINSYSIGQTIEIFYDSNNPENTAELSPISNKYNINSFWWIFMLIGFVGICYIIINIISVLSTPISFGIGAQSAVQSATNTIQNLLK